MMQPQHRRSKARVGHKISDRFVHSCVCCERRARPGKPESGRSYSSRRLFALFARYFVRASNGVRVYVLRLLIAVRPTRTVCVGMLDAATSSYLRVAVQSGSAMTTINWSVLPAPHPNDGPLLLEIDQTHREKQNRCPAKVKFFFL
jgi:hypothetical protein